METQLEWRQPKLTRMEFALCAGDREVGSLRFPDQWRSRAIGQYGATEWTFQRNGFWKPSIAARKAGSSVDWAVFTQRWTGGGTVTLESGATYEIKSANFWRSEWALLAEDGKVAATLRGPLGLFRQTGAVTVSMAGDGSEDVPGLVLLMWFVRLLTVQDGAAAATAATV